MGVVEKIDRVDLHGGDVPISIENRDLDLPFLGRLPAHTAGEASLETWWQQFDDPVLEELIGRARAGSLDLREDAARILEARARLGVASGQRLPAVDATAFYSYSEQSDEGSFGDLADVIGGFDAQSLYSGGFDASWEIDVFGGVRRSTQAATSSPARVRASLSTRSQPVVTLMTRADSRRCDRRSSTRA